MSTSDSNEAVITTMQTISWIKNIHVIDSVYAETSQRWFLKKLSKCLSEHILKQVVLSFQLFNVFLINNYGFCNYFNHAWSNFL